MTPTSRSALDAKLRVATHTETLGAAVVTHVFVHAITSFEQPAYWRLMGPAVERYAERALLLARNHDIVCVAAPVEDTFQAWLQHLDVGVPPDRMVVGGQTDAPTGGALPDSLADNARALEAIRRLIGNSPTVVLNPYLASPSEFHLAARLTQTLGRPVEVLGGSAAATERANTKHLVRARALELGIPVADGEVVDLGQDAAERPGRGGLISSAVERWLPHTGGVIVRASYASSGSGTLIVRGRSDPWDERFSRMLRETSNRYFLVESLLEAVSSPNILVHLSRGEPPAVVGATDQQLDAALAYRGSVFPSAAETLREMTGSAATLAAALGEDGIVGPVGFDFVEYVDRGTGRRRFVLAEVNPRINGASYSTSLMERLNAGQTRTGGPPIRSYLATRLETTAHSFAEFQRRYSALLFDRSSGRGVVPFNTGRLAHGCCSVAVFGDTPAAVDALYRELLSGIEREQ